MSAKTITPLRQRMIEDMNARKLGAHTQRGHIRSCKRFAAFLMRSPDTATVEHIRRFQLHLAETGMDNRQSQPLSTWVPLPGWGAAAATRSAHRDLSHPRAAEDSAGDEPRRDASSARCRRQPQGPHATQPWLRLRLTRQRGGSVE